MDHHAGLLDTRLEASAEEDHHAKLRPPILDKTTRQAIGIGGHQRQRRLPHGDETSTPGDQLFPPSGVCTFAVDLNPRPSLQVWAGESAQGLFLTCRETAVYGGSFACLARPGVAATRGLKEKKMKEKEKLVQEISWGS
eukprot:g38246.t1